jgi:Copper amine oxidase N-terminal domain.
MMKNKKRILCLLTALFLLMTALPSVTAAEPAAVNGAGIDLSKAKNVNELLGNQSKLFDVYMLAENIGDYYWVSPFSNGRAVVQQSSPTAIGARNDGVIDYYGKTIVPLVHGQAISDFQNGFARIYQNGITQNGWVQKYQYIDINGNAIFGRSLSGKREFVFGPNSTGTYGNLGDFEGGFNDGLAPVYSGSRWWYIDTSGTDALPLFDDQGNYALPLDDYDMCYSFSEGLALVIKDEKAGYINTKGEVVIDLIFSSAPGGWYRATSFSDGRACVLTQDGRLGFINRQGDFLFEIPHNPSNNRASFSEGYCLLSDYIYDGDSVIGGYDYYIDKNGKTVLDIRDTGAYRPLLRASEGLIPMYISGVNGQKQGFMDFTGKLVIDYKFDEGRGTSFKNGLAVVSVGGKDAAFFEERSAADGSVYTATLSGFAGIYGCIDKSGDYVVSPVYDRIAYGDDYLAAVQKDGIWSILYFVPKEDATAIPATAATPTSSTVLVNGVAVSFDAYIINENNYFKLRDLAYILSGTETQFDVSWDGANNAIALISGKSYTAVGGEMTGKGAGAETPTPTNSKIYVDGKEMQFAAYTIEGNNYFKLRDIGETFDFEIDWDGLHNTIIINTN